MCDHASNSSVITIWAELRRMGETIDRLTHRVEQLEGEHKPSDLAYQEKQWRLEDDRAKAG